MLIEKRSPITGKKHTQDIPVTEQQLSDWIDGGVKIQYAMPNLTPDQREFLMTGITKEEWDNVFGRDL